MRLDLFPALSEIPQRETAGSGVRQRQTDLTDTASGDSKSGSSGPCGAVAAAAPEGHRDFSPGDQAPRASRPFPPPARSRALRTPT